MDHNHGGGDGDDEGCPMIMTVIMNTPFYLEWIHLYEDRDFFRSNFIQFHVGNCESILFKQFTAKTVEGFVWAVVAIFLISIAYEGLKFWREKLYSDYAAETATACSSIKAGASATHNKQSVNRKSLGYGLHSQNFLCFQLLID